MAGRPLVSRRPLRPCGLVVDRGRLVVFLPGAGLPVPRPLYSAFGRRGSAASAACSAVLVLLSERQRVLPVRDELPGRMDTRSSAAGALVARDDRDRSGRQGGPALAGATPSLVDRAARPPPPR